MVLIVIWVDRGEVESLPSPVVAYNCGVDELQGGREKGKRGCVCVRGGTGGREVGVGHSCCPRPPAGKSSKEVSMGSERAMSRVRVLSPLPL